MKNERTRERCKAAIERRIRHYGLMKNAEDKLSAWYLATGYIEAMYDAEMIELDEYNDYMRRLEA